MRLFEKLKRTVNQIIESVKDAAIMPDIEISDFETLSRYKGKSIKLFDPNSGYEGHVIYGKISTCGKNICVFTADTGATIIINEGSFEKGILLFPVRESKN